MWQLKSINLETENYHLLNFTGLITNQRVLVSGTFKRMRRVDGLHAPGFIFAGACAEKKTEKGRRAMAASDSYMRWRMRARGEGDRVVV